MEAGFASLLAAGVAAGGSYAISQTMKPSTPKPVAPTRMPDKDDPAVLEARRRRVAETQAQGGRESTILSDDTYSNDLLGE